MGAVIDVHTHIVPARLAADPRRDRRWPSVELSAGDQAAVMIGGKVFRKIDTRSWDVNRRLADMVEDCCRIGCRLKTRNSLPMS